MIYSTQIPDQRLHDLMMPAEMKVYEGLRRNAAAMYSQLCVYSYTSTLILWELETLGHLYHTSKLQDSDKGIFCNPISGTRRSRGHRSVTVLHFFFFEACGIETKIETI